jgi:hypothetical protein
MDCRIGLHPGVGLVHNLDLSFSRATKPR